MGGSGINPTELVATLINRESSFAEGIGYAQEVIEGSCSLLLLTEDAIYAARDRLGRTPVVIGRKPGAYAATLETCALPNLDYEVDRYLGPGEIVRLTPDGVETLKPPGREMQICAFLWVYYGYPASCLRRDQRRSRSAIAAGRRWRGPTMSRSTSWPAFPTPARATPSATRTTRASRTAGRS